MPQTISIIGAGPGGLFAAEQLSAKGFNVVVYDRMPSVARKFLLAGRGGLNITHSEPLEQFLTRYRPQEPQLLHSIEAFPPAALQQWCTELGEETFIGSSGRVFPVSFKASPLLRLWLRRLNAQGVNFKLGWTWKSFAEGSSFLATDSDGTEHVVSSDATLLALGGGSWARLGSKGDWLEPFAREGIQSAPLVPSNCGFEVQFSEYFQAKFSGHPLKKIGLTHQRRRITGEIMIDATGVEGGGIYALSAEIREAISLSGKTELLLDLKPDLTEGAIVAKLQKPRGKNSFSNHLRKSVNLSSLAVALLREAGEVPSDPHLLAKRIKALPLTLAAPRPIDRAISSGGGLHFDEINAAFMLKKKPGVFACGEMLNWEAPTGGYLLQGVFATAAAAASGIEAYLRTQ
ncbi:TIGR03862 family flavoprotein [Pseudovibrio exalbescens]|uniref:TIGR03862 family flavoprotein n=1 Tax=Pseudovibrio exalbescens TaxID=197461 RepID=UPI0023662E5C|nr:TIGR03862 family flavoprotein [Pseudovibrio exalbescens]MDD7912087.1 TIGR03862 family flavoprotein [Pseudovibrio exalbescens]